MKYQKIFDAIDYACKMYGIRFIVGSDGLKYIENAINNYVENFNEDKCENCIYKKISLELIEDLGNLYDKYIDDGHPLKIEKEQENFQEHPLFPDKEPIGQMIGQLLIFTEFINVKERLSDDDFKNLKGVYENLQEIFKEKEQETINQRTPQEWEELKKNLSEEDYNAMRREEVDECDHEFIKDSYHCIKCNKHFIEVNKTEK